MTQKQIKEIRARCEAATPGRWWAFGPEAIPSAGFVNSASGIIAPCVRTNDDAIFIAHAREDIPALVEALESERERLANSQDGCEAWAEASLEARKERNWWKARAEAMERALNQGYTCYYCKYECGEEKTALCKERGRKDFDFDQARFERGEQA